MSTTDQNGSSRTPDEIRAEIERTRAGITTTSTRSPTR